MSRELVIELIKLKKRIHEDNHALVIAELDAEEELAYCSPTNEADLVIKRDQAVEKNLEAQARLKRAYLFSHRFCKGLVPSFCVTCFVDHNRESLMVEVPVDKNYWNGKKQYECPVCKHVLRTDETLNHPNQ